MPSPAQAAMSEIRSEALSHLSRVATQGDIPNVCAHFTVRLRGFSALKQLLVLLGKTEHWAYIPSPNDA